MGFGKVNEIEGMLSRKKQVQERVYVLLYNRKCRLSRGKRTP